jgi:hypothetical protein
MKLPITSKKIPIVIKKFGGIQSQGIYTKIITDTNINDYDELLQYLDTDEVPLIVCRFNPADWTLLTTVRVLSMNAEGLRKMNLEELIYVDDDMKGEIARGAKSMGDFTKLILRDINDQTFTINIEKGYPFGGFFQVLVSVGGYFPKGK